MPPLLGLVTWLCDSLYDRDRGSDTEQLIRKGSATLKSLKTT